ncbi:MAG TPA: phosphoribosylglycinamide formyltransferase [Lutibacter sp.]|nr:phosphoribosylglycinamide formyltransferase [Lutibacter sp.]
MIRIAVFASGNGTNAENIIKYFAKSTKAKVVLVLSNNKDAKVLDRAKHLNVRSLCFSKKDLNNSDKLNKLLLKEVDFIVLAGFLLKIPNSLIHLFPKKIINIHPALLPKYGGKGMFGMHVHQAVKDNNEKETGITIHYVNENYDEGAIIFQKKIAVSHADSPLSIANKIHKLEYEFFPIIINKLL